MTRIAKGGNLPVPAEPLTVAVTWTATAGGPDIDVSALLLDAGGRVRGDADLVFYNQPAHPGGAVRHLGKSPAGAAQRADWLSVDLALVDPGTHRVVVAASCDGGVFGGIPGLAVRIDTADGRHVVHFLIGDATTETAFVFGEFYRRAGRWKFRAVGQGYASGLAGLATDFGIEVADEPPRAAAAPPPAPPTVPVPPRPCRTRAVPGPPAAPAPDARRRTLGPRPPPPAFAAPAAPAAPAPRAAGGARQARLAAPARLPYGAPAPPGTGRRTGTARGAAGRPHRACRTPCRRRCRPAEPSLRPRPPPGSWAPRPPPRRLRCARRHGPRRRGAPARLGAGASPAGPGAPFSPFVQRGHGNRTVTCDGRVPPGWVLVEIECHDSVSVSVRSCDAYGRSEDSLLDRYEDHVRARAVGVAPEGRPLALRVEADTPWVLTVRPIGETPLLVTTAQGRGSDVLWYGGPPALLSFAHHGESNVTVHHLTDPADDYGDMLINEIGRVDLFAPVSGPGLIKVDADGVWSCAIRARQD
ncbi:TerD family protein [Streptomyces pactum]|uniref:TerD family protein n=1 Tax=Streptomyces pactum TaxID=68249 RepID=UPI001E2E8E37|nr:TerD family protein [Streptomyces pactum]